MWRGSTNWTETGMCTQANNGLMIDSRTIARAYLEHWNALRDAGSGYPASLAQADTTPVNAAAGKARATVWFTPALELVDLADARRLIQGAQQGVLSLMFIPGRAGTLLNDILDLRNDQLFVHGVINQDPGGKKNPVPSSSC